MVNNTSCILIRAALQVICLNSHVLTPNLSNNSRHSGAIVGLMIVESPSQTVDATEQSISLQKAAQHKNANFEFKSQHFDQ